MSPPASTWLGLASLRWPGVCRICARWFNTRAHNRAWCDDCQHSFTPALTRCVQCALAQTVAPNLGTSASGPSDAIKDVSVDAHVGLGVARWRCSACALGTWHWQGSTAAVDYAYPWASLITQLKYQRDTALAKPLAHLMLGNATCAAALQQADLWLGVPIAPSKLGLRGFNQTHLLLDHARAAHPHWSGARHWTQSRHYVQRATSGSDQQGLRRAQRLSNVYGAFTLAPNAHRAIAGQHIVLVDDVYTTGATLSALAQTVQAAGPASVQVCVLARTPEHHPTLEHGADWGYPTPVK